MGNGASVGNNQRHLPKLINIEKLATNGYFITNPDEYKLSIEECIKTGEMDILEILIPAGNAKVVLPLHIAAKLGSLEACELLLSAGFNYLSVDKRGYTPLHCCCLNRSSEALLCITLLGM